MPHPVKLAGRRGMQPNSTQNFGGFHDIPGMILLLTFRITSVWLDDPSRQDSTLMCMLLISFEPKKSSRSGGLLG
ncbi:hypothetical protein EVAR_28041_1 [Eumeta japonica]|uniref:Uncharacterized protein n=1 Tax=Eumeta variegata TaxID=151549 RepID=A0A4C1W7E4_EUMVA|nr:hypothetical protein EVAR_28041_1 [Eumeta japonica]